MQEVNLEEEAQLMIKDAAGFKKETGEMIPPVIRIIYWLDPEDRFSRHDIEVSEFMVNEEGKDRLAYAIRQMVKAKPNNCFIAAVVFMTEAWTVEANNKEDISGVVPSQHPDRKEAAIFIAETATEQLVYKMDLETLLDGTYTDVEPIRDMGMQGRFANFFEDIDVS